MKSDIHTERAATGITGLDNILGGGLPRGHLYLIEGDPGAGKTTLAMQFLLDGRKRGERGLYITLSETRAEAEKIASSHGWNLDGIDIYDLASNVAGLSPDDQYTVFHPAEVELGDTTRRILEHFEKVRPSRVVLDSTSELRLLAADPLRYRRQILSLKHYFAATGATVLLLDDRTVRNPEVQPQSVVHGIIELDRISSQYGAERRRLQIAKLRGSKFHGGYHDFDIIHGGLIVFPRLSASDHATEFDDGPVTTGLAEFDELMGGGIDRGTSTLFTGPAGTGKSSLALKMADAAVHRNDKVAVFAFEENQRIISRRSEALGIPLGDHIRSGMIQFRHIDPAELSPGEFASFVRDAVERLDAKMVIIDSLNGYLNSMPEEQFLLAQLHELLGYLNHRGVVTLLVLAQRGVGGTTLTAPVDLSYLADCIVLIRHFEAFGSVRKAISVLKKRTGTHEDTIRELRLADGGFHMGRVLTHFRGVLTGVPVFIGEHRDLTGEDE